MSKRRKPASRKGKRDNTTLYAIIAGVAVVVILIGAQLSGNRGNPQLLAESLAFYEGLPFAGTSIGDPGAPVKVVEYFDFQCPACQTASTSAVKPLIDKYVRSGDVHFTYRFFPILGPESVLAAEAGYCAAAQDSFWPYQDMLFARRGTGNQGTYSKKNLIAVARQMNLDQGAFTRCLDSNETKAYVQGAHQHAANLRLPGTPVFLVNNQPVGSSWGAIEAAIQEALPVGE